MTSTPKRQHHPDLARERDLRKRVGKVLICVRQGESAYQGEPVLRFGELRQRDLHL